MCKVQWSHHGEDETTLEREEELHIDFSPSFPSFLLNLEDEIIFKGGRICNTQFVDKNKRVHLNLCTASYSSSYGNNHI
jgi:hypothetical protein